VDPTADTTIEPDETVALTLVEGTGYTIGTTAAVVGTILDDDQIVSLAVAPATSSEDGSGNLIYTFSRNANGALNRALSVNYTVAGSATLGTDYTGIAATPAIKTITFAAGATTATLTVDPTADTTIEPDETVALTLVEGTGYTIGTTAAVVGTILDDDQIVSLAVAPATSSEDGSGNLIYTFSRNANGALNRSLTINYTIAGSATSDIDYTGLSVLGPTQSITFPAGALTASLTLDPIADSEIETDETISLTLVPGAGYTVSTTSAITGMILNDDMLIEAAGNTKLIRNSDGSGFAQVGHLQPIKITSPWGASIGSDATVWQILAAETIAGVNQLLWRNNIGNFLHTWRLDANWSWTGSFGMIAPSSSAAYELEVIFLVDANGDSIVGNPFDIIETKGNTSLLRRANGQAFAQVGNATPIAITSPWGAAVGSPSTAWQIIAVDTVAGVNQLLWRNNSANFLQTWSLDQNWSWTASNGTFDLNAPAGWSLESSFQVDANGDGIIGSPHSTIEAQGNTSLLRHANGQAYSQVGSITPIAIISPWGTPVGSSNSAWQMLAAENIAGVNQILLRNNSGNFLHTWTLDANWKWTSSNGTVPLNEASGWSLESYFQVDANNDGVIGAPYSTIESRGSTTLLRRTSDNQALVQVGTGPRTQVTTPWGAPIGTNTSDWQILAADTIGGVNQVLLRNNPGNFLHTWTLDSNWNWTASGGTFALNDTPGWTMESSFQVDANNDGIIGAPYSTIESRGTTTLLRRGSDDQAFIQVGTGPRTQVTTPWGAPIGTNTSTWQILAADTIGGVNQVLLRNNPGNFLHTWTFNSNWNWTASNGAISPTSAQGLALLNQFGLG